MLSQTIPKNGIVLTQFNSKNGIEWTQTIPKNGIMLSQYNPRNGTL